MSPLTARAAAAPIGPNSGAPPKLRVTVNAHPDAIAFTLIVSPYFVPPTPLPVTSSSSGGSSRRIVHVTRLRIPLAPATPTTVVPTESQRGMIADIVRRLAMGDLPGLCAVRKIGGGNAPIRGFYEWQAVDRQVTGAITARRSRRRVGVHIVELAAGMVQVRNDRADSQRIGLGIGIDRVVLRIVGATGPVHAA